MMTRFLTILIALGGLFALNSELFAEESPAAHHEITLSSDLLSVLRAEMREIAEGVQRITLALATADWKTVQETSATIHQSYVMKKELTPDQAQNWRRRCPSASSSWMQTSITERQSLGRPRRRMTPN